MSLNLLEDRFFTTKNIFGKKVEKTLNLPELFYALCQNEIFSFPKLQEYQSHSFYSFLANLMALCLDMEIDAYTNTKVLDVSILKNKSISDWNGLLESLRGHHTTAFDLIVDDRNKPAFFQPPTNMKLKGDVDLEKKNDPTRDTPDNFSLLHDKRDFCIKRSQIKKDSIEHWIYSLITIQTSCNYGGLGWYQSAKMASGTATRICASFVDKPFFSSRILRDVPLMLSNRLALKETFDLSIDIESNKLLWLVPRDANTEITLNSCHVLFIDCARIYRLSMCEKGNVSVFGSGSKNVFIKNMKEYRGVLGDFWLPIVQRNIDGVSKSSAIELKKDGSGFDYETMINIMLNTSVKTPALALSSESNQFKQGFLLLEGVSSGGNCKTSGFHKKYIPMTKGVLSRFAKANDESKLANDLQKISEKYFEDVKNFWFHLVEKPIKDINRNIDLAKSISQAKHNFENEMSDVLVETLSQIMELDDVSQIENIEHQWIQKLDQITFEKRELLFQQFYSQSVNKYEYFALLNIHTYKQKSILSKKTNYLEVKSHMSQIQVSIRSKIYAQTSKALELLSEKRKMQDNRFLVGLRDTNLDASLNPSFQEMIFHVFNLSLQDLKKSTLNENDINKWKKLFSWMIRSKDTNGLDTFGVLLQKANVNEARLTQLLQATNESLLANLTAIINMILSKDLVISKNAWVDITMLLFSTQNDDLINARRVIADAYFKHKFNQKINTNIDTDTNTNTNTNTKDLPNG